MNINDKWHEWTVKELLGEGSFGKVYRIERQEYGHTYVSALKELHIPNSQTEIAAMQNEGLDEESMTAYFEGMIENILTELVLMSELRGNSNIVSYEDHEVVKLKDRYGWIVYIRMELLVPLYDYLKQHTMTVQDVLRMGIDLCKALELCQKNRIIHRDIKPENIFYSPQGTFKLGDFGIARELEKTMDGMTKTGTPSYMAPEVYNGEKYNSTVDIYSLGIVLYRFLNNNRTPLLPDYPNPISFKDRREANSRRMSGEPLPAPCNADTRLGEIILKACAYDPKDRYQNAESFRKDLESVMDQQQETVVVRPDDIDSGSASKQTPKSVTEPGSGTEITMSMEEASANAGEPATEKPIRKKRKPVLFVLIVLAIVAACVTSYGYSYYHHTVPALVNMAAEEAQMYVEEEGLQYAVSDKAYSDSVPKGAVINQSPAEGSVVKKGTLVEVVLSKGVKKIKVPDVVGMTEDEAKEALQETGLKVKTEEEVSYEYEEGAVINQSIAAGKKVKKKTVVEITICVREEYVWNPGTTYRPSKKKSSSGSSGGSQEDPTTSGYDPTDQPTTSSSGGDSGNSGTQGNSNGDTGGGGNTDEE